LSSSLATDRIDAFIRFFLYVLIFWLPYSPAVVETCVILSLILWTIKRCLIFRKNLEAKTFKGQFKAIRFFRPVATPADSYILGFLLVGFISALGSPLFGKSLHGYISKTLEWFVIFYLVLEVFKEHKHIRILIFILIGTSLATAIDSFWQFFTGKDIFLGRTIETFGRVCAGFKTTNSLSGFLIFPILLAVSYILKGKSTLLWLGVIFILGTALVLTFTRTAWMAVILSFVFFLTLLKRDRKAFIFLSLSLAIAAILAFIFLSYEYNNRLFSQDRATSMSWRVTVWQDAFEMIGDRPFLGHGPNTFMDIFEFYRHRTIGDPTYAHNCFLQIAVETGLLGLGLFLLIFAKIFSGVIKYIREENNILAAGLFAGSIGFLFQSFFDTHLYSLQLSALFWVMTGLLVSVSKINHNKEKIT
jgi:putative inorganic carbon (HCO3(-)) transporter